MEVKVGDKKVIIKQADITEEQVDAIVNAANPYLKHGGGVAGAIVRKGGKIIQEESNKIGYVPVGEVAVTTAGKLKAKYVIHAVGPRWGEGDEEAKLRRAVRNALSKATELKLKSIAMPAISTGIFGYPKEEGTRVILEEVVNFLKQETTTVDEVRLVSIDKATYEMFLKHADRLK
ncbi:macro domain-containing protein [candidate division WOR-3 bacterium]|nr:macro domain-containing protein [candidate division WOR-3 bacterium]